MIYALNMAMLTTHVLDTYHGTPAAGVPIELARLGEPRETLVRTVTNAEGRCPQPLLAGDAMRTGIYELSFDLESYFRGKGVKLPQPPFLTTVVVRIGSQTMQTVLFVNGNQIGILGGQGLVPVTVAPGPVSVSVRKQNCVAWDTTFTPVTGRRYTFVERSPKC